MIWEALLIFYLFVGVMITVCASAGHHIRFGYKMHWLYGLVGVFFWPFILLFGGRKK